MKNYLPIILLMLLLTPVQSDEITQNQGSTTSTFRCEGIFDSFGEYEFEQSEVIHLFKDTSSDLYELISIGGEIGVLQPSPIEYGFDFPTPGGAQDSIMGSLDRNNLELSYFMVVKGIGVMSFKGKCAPLEKQRI